MDAADDVWPMPCVTVLAQIDTVSKEEALASRKENCTLLLVEREMGHCTQVEKEEDQKVKESECQEAEDSVVE